MQQAIFIILGALAMLVLGLIIYSFYLPSRIRVMRNLQIKAPAERIFLLINNLHNWPQWSPWHGKDPDMIVEFSGNDAGVGASYAWQSRHRAVGNGSMLITESRANEYLANEMHFMQQGTAKAFFRLEPSAEGTLVTWTMETEMGQNPVKKLMGKMMDKWVGGDFERGLNNLKKACE